MKLQTDTDIIAFLKAVDKCNGDVYFNSSEGDMLNLKSQLSKCLFLAVSSSSKENILYHGKITCTNPVDQTNLSFYLTD